MRVGPRSAALAFVKVGEGGAEEIAVTGKPAPAYGYIAAYAYACQRVVVRKGLVADVRNA